MVPPHTEGSMKNTTTRALGFGAFVLGPGEAIPDKDLTPEAVDWYTRHGCEPDTKPKAKKKASKKKSAVRRTFGG